MPRRCVFPDVFQGGERAVGMVANEPEAAEDADESHAAGMVLSRNGLPWAGPVELWPAKDRVNEDGRCGAGRGYLQCSVSAVSIASSASSPLLLQLQWRSPLV